MQIIINQKEVNLIPSDIANLKPTFTLLHGRKFCVKGINISLNCLIFLIKNEAIKTNLSRSVIKNYFTEIKSIKNKGYDQIYKENLLVRIITKIKHFFSEIQRRRLLKELAGIGKFPLRNPDLPNDMLHEIFSHLPMEETETWRLLNKRWQNFIDQMPIHQLAEKNLKGFWFGTKKDFYNASQYNKIGYYYPVPRDRPTWERNIQTISFNAKGEVIAYHGYPCKNCAEDIRHVGPEEYCSFEFGVRFTKDKLNNRNPFYVTKPKYYANPVNPETSQFIEKVIRLMLIKLNYRHSKAAVVNNFKLFNR